MNRPDRIPFSRSDLPSVRPAGIFVRAVAAVRPREPHDAKPPQQSADAPKTNKPDARSKQARVIAMLQSPTGTTIAAIMKATGWQPHSVRRFLAGVVRQRLKLKLISKKVDGNRIYQITSRTAGAPARPRLIAMPRVRIGPALPDREALPLVSPLIGVLGKP